MSFDVKKWLADPATCSDMPLYLFEDENVAALVEAAVTASRAESEAQIATLQLDLTKAVRLAADYGIERDALQSEVAILKESNKGYQRTAQTILEIKSEREELREALREGLRCVHGLLAEKSNDDLMTKPFLIGCQLWFREKSFLVSTPASGESKCPRCGSHLRHITFPIGASLPYRSCDDAWHMASGEPARKP